MDRSIDARSKGKLGGAWLARLVRCLGSAAVVLGLTAGAGTHAAPASPDICLAAARTAAAESGVPLAVLLAVALSESGRKQGARFVPWPWTLNIAGEGAYFDSRAAALARAQQAVAAGQTSVDLGCFQINARWHGDHFDGLAHMLDPVANARYAARFLGELYAESADWETAAGHYHSRTPRHAERYRKVFARHLAALDAGPLPAPSVGTTVVRGPNAFPLLQAGGPPTGPGSLVPARPGGGAFIGARPARSLWGP